VRRLAGVVIVGIALAGAAAAGYAVRAAGAPEQAPPSTIAVEEVAVVRTDLVQTETLPGTLGFSGEGTVRTGLAGTVTRLPAEADRLERNSVAFEIDGEPVMVLIGPRPAWRLLEDGVDDGSDVLQLEENLIALGFGPDDWEPNEEFGSATAGAIEDWREEAGLADGETVGLGQVIFLPAPVRVGELLVDVGQAVTPGTPMFATTGFTQEVVIDLDPDDVDLVEAGAPVTVTLPDDRVVPGVIEEVGRVVRASGPEPDAPGVLEVRVVLDEPVTEFDQAPVEVEVESERAQAVLAVPVRALLALSDGGYAVEVDGTLVQVDTGDFAGGLVEVAGAIEEGDLVTVPR
jgi:peptidoglycan hydrolase-like protein with peptidoglycan-binding domain